MLNFQTLFLIAFFCLTFFKHYCAIFLFSLYYLMEGLLESTGIEDPENHFCKACFDRCYPVDFDLNLSKDCLE